MTKDKFWQIIEQSRGVVKDDNEECEAQTEKLTALLTKMTAPQIIEFDELWIRYFYAAYRWDLWAVAYIVNGGCSDDAFMDFRGWLIAQGRAYFEAALQNAERAADRVEPDGYAGCEQILYVRSTVYQAKTGAEIPSAAYHDGPDEPVGENWNEDELEELYPALCKKFDA